jgi:hypothetical protein
MTISRPLIARYPVPTVTSISPDLGDTAGGEILTITGTGLTRTSSISIGGTDVPIFNVLSDTEIICQAPAHAAASGQSVLVTTNRGTSAPNSLYEWWSPAELSLTGYWDRSSAYQNVTIGTWAGISSAGSSGGRDLIQGTTAYQPIEINLEPNFDGSNDYIYNATAFSSYVTNTAGTVVALFTFNNSAALQAHPWNNAPVFTNNDGAGPFQLVVSSSGITASVYSSAAERVATISANTNQLHLAIMRWNGSNVGLVVDGSVETLTAHGGAISYGGSPVVGLSAYSTQGQFLGQIRTLLVMNTTISDANSIKLLKWARACRGLMT